MLRFLRIRNLAVIEAVEVEFEPGFNVLTGETGTGKSILVEAVGLLLGGRASADLVRTGEAQATIEAIFEDSGRELVIRREISSQGRSRAFIDGALATASALRALSARLVELHGQHEHQALLDPLTHLSLLDEYADLLPLVQRVEEAWGRLRLWREQLERSRMDGREKAARLDLIAFQLAEIERAAPQPGEDESLGVLRQVLANAERIRQLCDEGYATLYDSDQCVLAGLATVWKRVGELAAIAPQFASHLDAREAIKAQLEDLALSLRAYGNGVDASPGRLQETEERLALLERLKKKHGPELSDVIAKGVALTTERNLLTGAAVREEEIHQEMAAASQAFLLEARALSVKRRTAAKAFESQLERLVAELAMARTRFEVRFDDSAMAEAAWSARGIDAAELFVSPNPGEELRPLARIVSGGELSRIMLALKTLAAGESGGKTLIFDEVDAGIGGRVADVVGLRLRALGDRFQVLCITHLPQIAARGASQFAVAKVVRGERTVTSVVRLDQRGRVDEISRMLGGGAVTDSLRASATELLEAGAAGGADGESESERRKRKSARG